MVHEGYGNGFPEDALPFVAVILESDGTIYDHAWSWETGENYASEGYRVVALTDDGHLTRGEAQAMYDRRLADFVDCFGVRVGE